MSKCKMVSLRTQIERRREAVVVKQTGRKGWTTKGKPKQAGVPYKRIGNRDFGCPYRGKDRFSGQWKKYHDRSMAITNDAGIDVIRVYVYNNNRYEGSYRDGHHY